MMTARRLTVATLVAAASLAAMLAAGCTSPGPSASTTDIFDVAPFAPGEVLEYQVVTFEGELLGYGTFTAAADAGQLLLRQEYVEAETSAGMTPVTDETSVWVNASTFRPEGGEREIVRRDADGNVTTDRYEWVYGVENNAPRLYQTEHLAGRDERERELRLRQHFYDNESSLWLWRAVDLFEELDSYYVSVNAIEVSQQTVNIRVPQIESVTVPAGEFEAYRLLFRNGRNVRTAWIEVDAPHRVLRWDNGDVVLELLP